MATSSAEPEKLFRYSDVSLALDSEVMSESGRLAGSLAHFESTCREPGFRLSLGDLVGVLRNHCGECETIDGWVRRVGTGFLAADAGGLNLGIGPGLPWSRSASGWSSTGLSWLLPIIGTIIAPPWLLPAIIALPWIAKLMPTPAAPSPQPVPTPAPAPADTTDVPATPTPETPAQGGTETGSYNPDASTDDCVAFVRGQPNRQVPPGFSNKDFYSGDYKGASGTLPDETQYGQVPAVGAIMVESPNDAGITYGHASYVYEVTRDASGKVVSYKIVEGNWDTRPKDEQDGSPPVHYETFNWDETKQQYVSPSGKRSPDMFIY